MLDSAGNQIKVTAGAGALSLIPAGSTNGTSLGTLPAYAVGVRMYLATGDAVTFTIASSQPGSAPSVTFTLGPTTTGPNWDENLTAGQMVYVTSVTGTPKFRWI